jgi:RES domain-containing protein
MPKTMSPLFNLHRSTDVVGWRLDQAKHAATWDSGIGASIAAGRWNHKGRNVVYTSADPATAILEVAVHVGFRVLDSMPYVLSHFSINDPSSLHIVYPEQIPNPNWLTSGPTTSQQRDFGHSLLDAHAFVALPSVVSSSSWNIIFDPLSAPFAKTNGWTLIEQVRFGLDTRLAVI